MIYSCNKIYFGILIDELSIELMIELESDDI